MKITSLTTYRVAPRWMFLKIETDEGIVGWGEPVLEGRARTVEAAVHELGATLIGKDPSRINDLWQSMYRADFYRGGAILMSAIAGIDQALWDIKGKALGVPVYQLLGGRVRDTMKVYSWVGGDRPADVIEQHRAPARGRLRHLQAQRLRGDGDARLARARSTRRWPSSPRCATRSAHTIDFGLDFHGRVALPMAKPLLQRARAATARCSSRSRCWPSRPSTTRAWPRRRRSRWPPASACTRASSSSACFEGGGIAIVQPDLSHAGGITECHKIAAMAEAYDVALAPHCPLGPDRAGGLPAGRLRGLQRRAAGAEHGHPLQPGRRAARLRASTRTTSASRAASSQALHEAGPRRRGRRGARACTPAKNAPDWRNPVWRHADGSVAEW